MRRAAQFLSVVGIASALVLAGVLPASAVEPPPPPVTPASGLPSWSGVYYNPNGLTPGSPGYTEWLNSMKARVPPPVTDLKPSASLPGLKPITAAQPFMRGVGVTGATSLLAAGAIAGWAAGNGGLALYGVATGTDPWAAMCGADPGPEQALADIQRGINFGIGPTCVAPVAQPNADQAQTVTIAGGPGMAGKATIVEGWGANYAACWSGPPPSGYTLQGFSTQYNSWTQLTPAAPYAGACSAQVPGTNTGTQDGYQYTGQSRVNSFSSYGMRHTATGALTVGVAQLSNPERSPSCIITWSDGTQTTGLGNAYRESNGPMMSAEGLGCKPAFASKHPGGGYAGGATPTRIQVKSMVGSGGAQTVISDQAVGSSTDEQKAALATGSTAGLVLTKTVDGVTDSCMTWAANCANWWADTSSGTVPTTGTRTYTCTFGGATVTLAECGIYRHTFDVRTATPTVTDPVTGEEEDWVTSPTSGNPANSGDPGTLPNGSTNPGADCLMQWPSAPDPVSWVLHPVKCALVWAFVPRGQVVTALFLEAELVWATKPPAALIHAAGLIDGMTGPTGCSIPITFLGVTADIINVCDGLMAQLPIFTRLITGAYAVIIVYTKLREQSAAMVNYNVGQT